MELSPAQGAACDQVVQWFNGGDSTPQVFRLFGYAGTGKTTLARYIQEQLAVEAVFAAYTGKAASVLQRKGVHASTIHSLIYIPARPDEDLIESLKKRIVEEKSEALQNVLKKELETARKPRFRLREDEELTSDLIVVDEVSMVGAEVGRDLLSFGKKVLVLGDPAQLPPVEGGGFFTDAEPDVLLTEIHRQASGNPIISMATRVRQGHGLPLGSYGSSRVIDRRNENHDPKAFDQLVVGTNRTRNAWNKRYRQIFGHLAVSPEQGEKVICLRNNREKGLLNGTLWRVKQCEELGWGVKLELFDWEDEFDFDEQGLVVEAHNFDVDLKQKEYYERKRAEEFDFGYAMTCHKAQGSQWARGYIANEAFIFKEHARRWLYTAITRFSDSIVVAQ